MTSSQRNHTSGLIHYPSFFSDLERMWTTMFFNECERLAISKTSLDGEELEARAEEITNYYFYLKAKDRLPFYRDFDILWRSDLR